MKQTPDRRETIEKAIAALDGPISIQELAGRAAGSHAGKTAHSTIRLALKRQHIGRDLVPLDSERVIPMRLAFAGVRFRVRLDREEAKAGGVFVSPAFDFFLGCGAEQATFVDAQGKMIPARVANYEFVAPDLFGGPVHLTMPLFDMQEWFKELGVKGKDSLLVTVLDWGEGQFQLEHEPARAAQKKRIREQNRALADVLYALLEETRDERIETRVAIPAAYARLPGARDYPGDHWAEVLQDDPRMRTDLAEIIPGDQMLPFEDLFEDEYEERPLKRLAPAQARQVYRFIAEDAGRIKTRVIEIQGKHTLGQFDLTMRSVFRLDDTDHLSEFTRVTPRGKGKRPHRLPYGAINPFQDSPANGMRVADLELEPGATLEYLYDFGDNLLHRLTLEAVHPPEKGIEYPRTKRSK